MKGSSQGVPAFMRKKRVIALAALAAAAAGAIAWGTVHRVPDLLIDSLLTSEHRRWAVYLIGQRAYDRRMAAYREQFDRMAQAPQREMAAPASASVHASSDSQPLVRVEAIHGLGYNGYLMYVRDPMKVRVCIPASAGTGETVSDMVRRTGAIAGINGGGFVDPHWQGNGYLPNGIVMSGGRIYFNGVQHDQPVDIVGLDDRGRLIAGRYAPSRLTKLNLREAVSFYPRLIVNGKGLLDRRDDAWGIAPRTAIGQTADGTLLFAVIDGRQADSIGATLYDMQQLLLERGAIVAANLDGGASSVMVHDDEIVNHPSAGAERAVPTAFVVLNDPDRMSLSDVWSGLQPSEIDPSAGR